MEVAHRSPVPNHNYVLKNDYTMLFAIQIGYFYLGTYGKQVLNQQFHCEFGLPVLVEGDRVAAFAEPHPRFLGGCDCNV